MRFLLNYSHKVEVSSIKNLVSKHLRDKEPDQSYESIWSQYLEYYQLLHLFNDLRVISARISRANFWNHYFRVRMVNDSGPPIAVVLKTINQIGELLALGEILELLNLGAS